MVVALHFWAPLAVGAAWNASMAVKSKNPHAASTQTVAATTPPARAIHAFAPTLNTRDTTSIDTCRPLAVASAAPSIASASVRRVARPRSPPHQVSSEPSCSQPSTLPAHATPTSRQSHAAATQTRIDPVGFAVDFENRHASEPTPTAESPARKTKPATSSPWVRAEKPLSAIHPINAAVRAASTTITSATSSRVSARSRRSSLTSPVAPLPRGTPS